MKTTSNQRSSKSQLPAYFAYQVIEPTAEGKSARWNRLGAFFPHQDGQGGTLVLDTLPIHFDGRVVLRAPAEAEDAE